MIHTLAMIMAGGKGTRLGPLTAERAKPAVPFGGKYRIIDFVLSNFVNSEIYSIYVLTQFKAQSLVEHIRRGWWIASFLRDQFIIPVPAQMRTGDTWYQGTADAIYQNLNLVENAHAEHVAVFGGDHIYKMDVRQMIGFHVDAGAECTVAALPVPIEQSNQFGILEVDEVGRVTSFLEKPAKPRPMPGDPTRVLASMGNYVFPADLLKDVLEEDSRNPDSTHDFGKDVLPSLVKRGKLYAYDFTTNRIPGLPPNERNDYRRDVGTLDAYFEANMDLRNVKPEFNLYQKEWPIRTVTTFAPPAKFVLDEVGRQGRAINSVISDGCIVSGSLVHQSVLSRGVHVHSFAEVRDSIIMDNCDIGRHARVRRAILDKNVRVAEGDVIGYDLERDRARFHVTDSGLVVIPKMPEAKPVSRLQL
jgi:glucose-1-phosphate adenylyltransferase